MFLTVFSTRVSLFSSKIHNGDDTPEVSPFFFLAYVSSLPIPFPIFIFPFSLLRCTDTQPCFNFTYSFNLFWNSLPPALSFWFILYNPFPHYFICYCIQTFYRILSTSIYFMYLVPSVLNPISTFLMWYSLVQPSWISSVLTVTSLRSALFWAITQLAVVISYWLYRTTYRFHLQGVMKMWPICCPETFVRNYRSSLRDNPEERSCNLLRDGSL